MANYREKLQNISTLIFDFDGVLSDGNMMLWEGEEMPRRVNVKDGYALQLAIKKGFRIIIISGGYSESVRQRFLRLGLSDVFMKVENKIETYRKYIKEHNIKPENIMYMGDDIPDYNVMKEVALPVCPADACEEIKSISEYISHKNGGEGCVRDIIEQILKVQNKWFDKDALNW